MGLKSGFRVTLNAGLSRAIEIDLLVVFLIFEVPILGARMRGPVGVSHFLMFVQKNIKHEKHHL